MSPSPQIPVRAAGAVTAMGTAVLLAACGGPHSALDPRSDAAAGIAQLWWLLLAVCLAVFVIVLGLYGWAVWRRRPGEEAEPTGGIVNLIVVGGAAVPALILLGLTAGTVVTSSRLDLADAGNGEELLEIEVVGHQFWWEVRYPGTGAVTANEIHVPAGRTVRVKLSSADVIHSFWVPQLHGKVDMTPGRTSELVLAPREPGVYRGFCSEFCGVQHALMGMLVVAQAPDDFEAWLEEQARPAEPPSDQLRRAGESVFVDKECHFCHTVRGRDFGASPATSATATGPDLTHLGSRRTLAAGTLDNGREALATWVVDPAAVKPGARMPSTAMSDEEVEALVAYLEGLR